MRKTLADYLPFTHRRRLPAMVAAVLLLAPLTSAQAAPLTTSSASSSPPAAGIEWREDMDAALAEAAAGQKLVLLRFTATWCAPCRVMDARVWPDPAVLAAVSEKYLPVKIDIDADASAAIIRKYGVQAVPTLIIADAAGEELARGGFMSPAKLAEFLETAQAENAAQKTRETEGDNL